MKIGSLCGCIVFDSNPTSHPYTHPIRTIDIGKGLSKVPSWDISIQEHEMACGKAQSIKDDILMHQSLDGPYLCD